MSLLRALAWSGAKQSCRRARLAAARSLWKAGEAVSLEVKGAHHAALKDLKSLKDKLITPRGECIISTSLKQASRRDVEEAMSILSVPEDFANSFNGITSKLTVKERSKIRFKQWKSKRKDKKAVRRKKRMMKRAATRPKTPPIHDPGSIPPVPPILLEEEDKFSMLTEYLAKLPASHFPEDGPINYYPPPRAVEEAFGPIKEVMQDVKAPNPYGEEAVKLALEMMEKEKGKPKNYAWQPMVWDKYLENQSQSERWKNRTLPRKFKESILRYDEEIEAAKPKPVRERRVSITFCDRDTSIWLNLQSEVCKEWELNEHREVHARTEALMRSKWKVPINLKEIEIIRSLPQEKLPLWYHYLLELSKPEPRFKQRVANKFRDFPGRCENWKMARILRFRSFIESKKSEYRKTRFGESRFGRFLLKRKDYTHSSMVRDNSHLYDLDWYTLPDFEGEPGIRAFENLNYLPEVDETRLCEWPCAKKRSNKTQSILKWPGPTPLLVEAPSAVTDQQRKTISFEPIAYMGRFNRGISIIEDSPLQASCQAVDKHRTNFEYVDYVEPVDPVEDEVESVFEVQVFESKKSIYQGVYQIIERMQKADVRKFSAKIHPPKKAQKATILKGFSTMFAFGKPKAKKDQMEDDQDAIDQLQESLDQTEHCNTSNTTSKSLVTEEGKMAKFFKPFKFNGFKGIKKVFGRASSVEPESQASESKLTRNLEAVATPKVKKAPMFQGIKQLFAKKGPAEKVVDQVPTNVYYHGFEASNHGGLKKSPSQAKKWIRMSKNRCHRYPPMSETMKQKAASVSLYKLSHLMQPASIAEFDKLTSKLVSSNSMRDLISGQMEPPAPKKKSILEKMWNNDSDDSSSLLEEFKKSLREPYEKPSVNEEYPKLSRNATSLCIPMESLDLMLDTMDLKVPRRAKRARKFKTVLKSAKDSSFWEQEATASSPKKTCVGPNSQKILDDMIAEVDAFMSERKTSPLSMAGSSSMVDIPLDEEEVTPKPKQLTFMSKIMPAFISNPSQIFKFSKSNTLEVLEELSESNAANDVNEIEKKASPIFMPENPSTLQEVREIDRATETQASQPKLMSRLMPKLILDSGKASGPGTLTAVSETSNILVDVTEMKVKDQSFNPESSDFTIESPSAVLEVFEVHEILNIENAPVSGSSQAFMKKLIPAFASNPKKIFGSGNTASSSEIPEVLFDLEKELAALGLSSIDKTPIPGDPEAKTSSGFEEPSLEMDFEKPNSELVKSASDNCDAEHQLSPNFMPEDPSTSSEVRDILDKESNLVVKISPPTLMKRLMPTFALNSLKLSTAINNTEASNNETVTKEASFVSSSSGGSHSSKLDASPKTDNPDVEIWSSSAKSKPEIGFEKCTVNPKQMEGPSPLQRLMKVFQSNATTKSSRCSQATSGIKSASKKASSKGPKKKFFGNFPSFKALNPIAAIRSLFSKKETKAKPQVELKKRNKMLKIKLDRSAISHQQVFSQVLLRFLAKEALKEVLQEMTTSDTQAESADSSKKNSDHSEPSPSDKVEHNAPSKTSVAPSPIETEKAVIQAKPHHPRNISKTVYEAISKIVRDAAKELDPLRKELKEEELKWEGTFPTPEALTKIESLMEQIDDISKEANELMESLTISGPLGDESMANIEDHLDLFNLGRIRQKTLPIPESLFVAEVTAPVFHPEIESNQPEGKSIWKKFVSWVKREEEIKSEPKIEKIAVLKRKEDSISPPPGSQNCTEETASSPSDAVSPVMSLESLPSTAIVGPKDSEVLIPTSIDDAIEAPKNPEESLVVLDSDKFYCNRLEILPSEYRYEIDQDFTWARYYGISPIPTHFMRSNPNGRRRKVRMFGRRVKAYTHLEVRVLSLLFGFAPYPRTPKQYPNHIKWRDVETDIPLERARKYTPKLDEDRFVPTRKLTSSQVCDPVKVKEAVECLFDRSSPSPAPLSSFDEECEQLLQQMKEKKEFQQTNPLRVHQKRSSRWRQMKDLPIEAVDAYHEKIVPDWKVTAKDTRLEKLTEKSIAEAARRVKFCYSYDSKVKELDHQLVPAALIPESSLMERERQEAINAMPTPWYFMKQEQIPKDPWVPPNYRVKPDPSLSGLDLVHDINQKLKASLRDFAATYGEVEEKDALIIEDVSRPSDWIFEYAVAPEFSTTCDNAIERFAKHAAELSEPPKEPSQPSDGPSIGKNIKEFFDLMKKFEEENPQYYIKAEAASKKASFKNRLKAVCSITLKKCRVSIKPVKSLRIKSPSTQIASRESFHSIKRALRDAKLALVTILSRIEKKFCVKRKESKLFPSNFTTLRKTSAQVPDEPLLGIQRTPRESKLPESSILHSDLGLYVSYSDSLLCMDDIGVSKITPQNSEIDLSNSELDSSLDTTNSGEYPAVSKLPRVIDLDPGFFYPDSWLEFLALRENPAVPKSSQDFEVDFSITISESWFLPKPKSVEFLFDKDICEFSADDAPCEIRGPEGRPKIYRQRA